MEKTGGRIAVYSRKSRFTGKGESIGNQEQLCRTYVRSIYGPEAAAETELFEDEGFSGGDLNRPGFRAMMDRVRQGEFRAIVVYRLDRISRNISDFAGLIDELTKLDVAFISIREQFDTGSPMGRAMMYIISVFSQLERETIAQRIRDNMLELARTGRWLGGITPTGYISRRVSTPSPDGRVRKACRLELNPGEAETVRLIFRLYREKGSLTGVETELLRMGVRSRTGRNHSRFSIRGILSNPVYMEADARARDWFLARGADVCGPEGAFTGERGIMAYNRTEQEKGKTNVLLPVGKWIVAVGEHPALVSSEVWIGVQNLLERNKAGAYRQPRRNEALLTGLLYCACGSRMYPKLSGRRGADGEEIWSYVCKGKSSSRAFSCSRRNLPGPQADRMVLDRIGELEEDTCLLLDRIRKYRISTENSSGEEPEIEGLQRKRRENERKMDGLLDALALSEDPEARLRLTRRLEELCDENSRLEQRVRLREASRTGEKKSGEGQAEKYRDFSEVLRMLTVSEKRCVMAELVSRGQWDGETLEVFL